VAAAQKLRVSGAARACAGEARVAVRSGFERRRVEVVRGKRWQQLGPAACRRAARGASSGSCVGERRGQRTGEK